MTIGDYEIEEQYSEEVPLTNHRKEIIESFPLDLRDDIRAVFRHFDTDRMLYTIRHNGKCIGEITLASYSTPTPEIGIEFIKDYRGKGIGYLLTNAVLNKLRDSRKYEYVVYIVRDGNTASVKLVEKLGGIAVGRNESVPGLNLLTYHIPMTITDGDKNE